MLRSPKAKSYHYLCRIISMGKLEVKALFFVLPNLMSGKSLQKGHGKDMVVYSSAQSIRHHLK